LKFGVHNIVPLQGEIRYGNGDGDEYLYIIFTYDDDSLTENPNNGQPVQGWNGISIVGLKQIHLLADRRSHPT
jgi:hypothetical protein